ncbi:hypothetical protein RhiirA5_385533 [Rhizophagus irregularis]|uniref:Uncharacterized protein n=1 Tax=Rhizophagus irregularis TaxID=588596 RepID=A0A2N0NNJ5_9GLOM|nr:hypothetical protein RhiirA5_385533 [Rhizophagus irregularis]
MKYAYIYVDKNNFPDNINGGVSTPFNGSSIYIYPNTISPKTCNICGAHTHEINNCDDTNFTLDKNNRKIFNKRIIKRNDEKITIDDKYKKSYNHVITLNANKTRPNDHNSQQPTTRTSYSKQQYQPPQIPNYFNQDKINNNLTNNQQINSSYSQTNLNLDYNTLLEKVKSLENQVQTLTYKISQLESKPKQLETQFSNIENQVNNMETNMNIINKRQDKYDEIIQKLTKNISKLSDSVHNKEKSIKQSKCSSPYEKTSYEQSKKKHYTRSSKSPCTSANKSDSFAQTEDDTIMQQELESLMDNAVHDSVIEPDSDYTPNDNITSSTSYGYNIFNFRSNK